MSKFQVTRIGIRNLINLKSLIFLDVSGVRIFDSESANLFKRFLPKCKIIANHCSYANEIEQRWKDQLKLYKPQNLKKQFE